MTSQENIVFVLVIHFLVTFLTNLCVADGTTPLNTREFFKQIYSDVCPSADVSCLREVMEGSFQLSLPRNTGSKVGLVEKIKLFENSENSIKTLSHNPPIFEIEDFFTADECDFVIDFARAKRLKRKTVSVNAKTMFMDEIGETFKMWNLNGDDFIDASEVAYVYGKSGAFVTEENVLDMFKETKIDTDEDGKLDEDEFQEVDQKLLENFINTNIIKERNSETNNAYIEQTWLWHDDDELLAYEDVFENYHDRVVNLTKLPRKVVEHSEPVQVVKYESGAHDECHHDTQSYSTDRPCCQYGSTNCRLCRYLTITVFLTDDYDGGEKCFPFADNETFSQKDLPRQYLKKCNLARSCDGCNVKVKPKKGKAVMWYNHLLNRHGWMGTLDAFSGHGDCTNTNGEKWVANIWIDILGDGKRELKSWKSGTNWIKPGNKNAEIYRILGNPELKPKSDIVQANERYSKDKNALHDANIRIGDTKLHFNNIKPVSETNYYNTKPQSKQNRIVQSILLLLDELNQDELDLISDIMKSKLRPS